MNKNSSFAEEVFVKSHHFCVCASVRFHCFFLHVSNYGVCTKCQRNENDPWKKIESSVQVIEQTFQNYM